MSGILFSESAFGGDPDAVAVACSDCGWQGKATDTHIIEDFQERVSPGEIVPAGECPECGALAHLSSTPEWARSRLWCALSWSDESGELDVSFHPTKEAAQEAILAELEGLYGEIFRDDPVPRPYDESVLSDWVSENLIRYSWAIRQKDVELR